MKPKKFLLELNEDELTTIKLSLEFVRDYFNSRNTGTPKETNLIHDLKNSKPCI